MDSDLIKLWVGCNKLSCQYLEDISQYLRAAEFAFFNLPVVVVVWDLEVGLMWAVSLSAWDPVTCSAALLRCDANEAALFSTDARPYPYLKTSKSSRIVDIIDFN